MLCMQMHSSFLDDGNFLIITRSYITYTQCFIFAQTVSFYAQLHSEKKILLYTVPLDRRSEVRDLY